jgi:RNA polymerase sigma-70 factor (ECF subfamily)
MAGQGDAAVSPERARLIAASDEDLMLSVAKGDEIAFRILVQRNARRAFGIARRIAASDEDAEEIVQEAMIRVWTSAPRWRPEAAFMTWLYRITVNLSLNRRRQRIFAPLDDAGDPADCAPGALERLEEDERHKFVTEAIARLPDRQRAALVMTYYEGLSNAETAEVLDTTVSSVESLLIRAKRTLRGELGRWLDGDPGDVRL